MIRHAGRSPYRPGSLAGIEGKCASCAQSLLWTIVSGARGEFKRQELGRWSRLLRKRDGVRGGTRVLAANGDLVEDLQPAAPVEFQVERRFARPIQAKLDPAKVPPGVEPEFDPVARQADDVIRPELIGLYPDTTPYSPPR